LIQAEPLSSDLTLSIKNNATIFYNNMNLYQIECHIQNNFATNIKFLTRDIGDNRIFKKSIKISDSDDPLFPLEYGKYYDERWIIPSIPDQEWSAQPNFEYASHDDDYGLLMDEITSESLITSEITMMIDDLESFNADDTLHYNLYERYNDRLKMIFSYSTFLFIKSSIHSKSASSMSVCQKNIHHFINIDKKVAITGIYQLVGLDTALVPFLAINIYCHVQKHSHDAAANKPLLVDTLWINCAYLPNPHTMHVSRILPISKDCHALLMIDTTTNRLYYITRQHIWALGQVDYNHLFYANKDITHAFMRMLLKINLIVRLLSKKPQYKKIFNHLFDGIEFDHMIKLETKH
jgi:hypothetical protein